MKYLFSFINPGPDQTPNHLIFLIFKPAAGIHTLGPHTLLDAHTRTHTRTHTRYRTRAREQVGARSLAFGSIHHALKSRMNEGTEFIRRFPYHEHVHERYTRACGVASSVATCAHTPARARPASKRTRAHERLRTHAPARRKEAKPSEVNVWLRPKTEAR